jgi:hypothetical protein
MRLLNKTLTTFSDANYVSIALNKAINTSYLPIGDNVTEVVSNFSKIQLSRSFSDCGFFGQADLKMTFNEKELLISYSSTSLTSVDICYKLSNNMEVKEIQINVWIPDNRCQSGRTHYECLTEALYPNWDSFQSELIEMNPNVVLPQPEWYTLKLSNVDNEPRKSRRSKVRSKVDEVIENYEYENEVDYNDDEE